MVVKRSDRERGDFLGEGLMFWRFDMLSNRVVREWDGLKEAIFLF